MTNAICGITISVNSGSKAIREGLLLQRLSNQVDN